MWDRGQLSLYGRLGFEPRIVRSCGLESFAIKGGGVTLGERLRDWDERVAVRDPYI